MVAVSAMGERSMIGSTAQTCVEVAIHLGHAKRAKRTLTVSPTKGKASSIPPNTCLKCGMQGRHAGAKYCIEALRDEMSYLEMKLDEPIQKSPAVKPPAPPPDPAEQTGTPAVEVSSQPPPIERKQPMTAQFNFTALLAELEAKRATLENAIGGVRAAMEALGVTGNRAPHRRYATRPPRRHVTTGVTARILAELGANSQTGLSVDEIARRVGTKKQTVNLVCGKLMHRGSVEKTETGNFACPRKLNRVA